jgi:hypothetical protein
MGISIGSVRGACQAEECRMEGITGKSGYPRGAMSSLDQLPSKNSPEDLIGISPFVSELLAQLMGYCEKLAFFSRDSCGKEREKQLIMKRI